MIFAILFPAVTGFSQGVSMSGDLKDPSRSLPLGTFLAVGLSTLVYTGAMVALAGSASVTGLAADYDAIARVAWTPIAIDAGVLAATLSSALASFIGAPRILQALARDRLFAVLTPLGQGYGDRDNPRRAVALTAVIALGTIAAGDLNAIASLVSMFFLVSYGLLNYATYVEAVAASPSFRPRFRFFHARASLAGTALCGLVMLMIDPMASAIALGMLSAVYHYLRRTAIPVRWHDNQHAYRFRRVKDGLRELTEHAEGSSDWQPHILAFTETVERRERVLRVASWIAGGSGLITAVQLVEGDGASAAVRQQCLEAERALRSELDATSLDAFPLVVAAPDLRTATLTLLQSWGVGPIRANTVLLNWRDSRGREAPSDFTRWYGRLLRRAEAPEWEALLARAPHDRRIDVWWLDDDSSKLALLFAYLMTRSDVWDEGSIRLLAPAPAGAADRVVANLTPRLEEMRIDATIEPVTDPDPATVHATSSDAALVLLPLRLAGMRVVDPFGGSIDELLAGLPIVALVAAARDLPLDEAEAEAEEDAVAPGPAEADGEPA